MLLFLSLTAIFATIQPSMHDSTRTTAVMAIAIITVHTADMPGRAVIKYTQTAGAMTTPEYISPMRYTPIRRAAMISRTGIGMESSRSLSLAS